MRLTIKDKEIRDNFNAEYAKLADLEDIEEEFGIDSIEDLRDRLTTYKFLANHGMSCVDANAYNLMLEDLNKYHSIEKELGIDLMTLFKALANGIWCKKGGHSLHTDVCLNTNKEWVIGCWLTKYECVYFCLKDYDTTWVLTKEELE